MAHSMVKQILDRLEPRILRYIGFRLSSTALAYGLTLLLARLLGPSGFGTYGVIVMVVGLVSVPLGRGWSTLVLRSAAASEEREISSDTQQILDWGRKLSLGWVAAIVLPLAAATYWMGWPWFIGLLLMVSVFLKQNSSFRLALMRGKGFPVLNQIPEQIIQPMIIAAIAVAVYYATQRDPDWTEVFTAYVIALSISYAAGLFMQHRVTGDMVCEPVDPQAFHLGRSMRNAAVIGANGFVITLSAQVDTYILAAMGNADEVGIYRFAIQLSLIGAFVYTSLNYLAAAEVARHLSREEHSQLRRLTRNYSWLAVLGCLAFIGILLVIGRPFIAWTAGAHFLPALGVCLVLLVGQVVNAAVGMAANVLTMSGNELVVITGTVVSLITSALLTFLLVPQFGIYGAAIANVAGVTVVNLFYLIQCLRRVGANPSIFGR